MTDILERCMGLDIHRDTIVACLLRGPVDAKPESEIRTFGTLAHEMEQLQEWVLESQCRTIAMESTGIYWQPIYELLECCFDGDIQLLVVNARHMKNVPGKKTDIRDSEWIATLLRAGLLKSSFIPDKAFRELRHFTRYRKRIVSDITSQKNRIDKFLQSSGFRLSMFLSDIFGASGRNIMRHLVAHGQIDREGLDLCLKTKTRNRIEEILVSINGYLSEHQRQFLIMMLSHLEQIETHKKQVEDAIESEIVKHSKMLSLLCSIPGIDVTAASSIIAEIGTDLSAFPSAEHLCSWAGLAPGNNESAGKRKSTRVGKGNTYLKSMLCEIAWVICGKRKLYLSGWYWRIKQRKGAKRATVALARKILTIIYTMFKTGQPFDEDCFEQRRKQCEQKRASRMINELQKLGFRIEPIA
jgi:Transposase and inactivated derivatives